jgi:hypothetical protein
MSSVDVGVLSPAYEEFRGEDSFFGGVPPLSEGVGYLVVLGFGIFFSFVTTGIVWANNFFGGKTEITSEHFKYVQFNSELLYFLPYHFNTSTFRPT